MPDGAGGPGGRTRGACAIVRPGAVANANGICALACSRCDGDGKTGACGLPTIAATTRPRMPGTEGIAAAAPAIGAAAAACIAVRARTRADPRSIGAVVLGRLGGGGGRIAATVACTTVPRVVGDSTPAGAARSAPAPVAWCGTCCTHAASTAPCGAAGDNAWCRPTRSTARCRERARARLRARRAGTALGSGTARTGTTTVTTGRAKCIARTLGGPI